MQITSAERLVQFRNLLQSELFPVLESAVGRLSKQGQLLTAIVSLQPLAGWLKKRRAQTGRPPCDRLRLATALLAKAVFNLPSTRHLIERLHSDSQFRRLCGWERSEQVPTEATFSRAFSEFAASGLPTQIHAALVKATQQEREIEHIARDSTAIEAREHLPEDKVQKNKPPKHHKRSAATKKPLNKKQPKKKPAKPKGSSKGKRRKGGPHPRSKASERNKRRERQPPKDRTRLARQLKMTLAEMQAELPKACSLGVKTSSQGHQQYWRGYKLHWDVADGGRIPISCVLTGANVHDSQVAIPLMRLSGERVRWQCEVMDRAYDARLIHAESRRLGHEPLIQPQKRPHTPLREFSEEEKQRFKKRTIVEQLNARLKDEFGGRLIYYRGASKIMAHLMFGIVALTVDQLLRQSP